MRRKGCLNLKMDDILWHGLNAQIDSATFQNRVIMPSAKSLADKLELALHPQVKLLGISGSKELSDQQFWNRTSAELTEMFMKALVLKGSLDASPFEFNFCWIAAGEEYVYEEVERPIGSPPGEKGIVGAATTPVLKCRCPGDYAYPRRVYCRAEVAFRPEQPS
ncbi:hypothetical protein M409DRAFT_18512 [Zasmidium cellare ATCC 36951]|uniref:Uncharacterized protein n=1 Tax=Zasmidium cellare ATCC 36951 TaxID=1080233 RepID=A0A6A6CW31_ZASCE|nr:uncharacterized protein M409DRAFT_18512 [Zasmidium cellare ATCC 36951]KAF2171397.1 hypothetical protein M409DRAFT_18512 [Zasmidium cellare ATCC 36951]